MAGSAMVYRCTSFESIGDHCPTCHFEWMTGQGWPIETYRSDVERRWVPVDTNALMALSCCVSQFQVLELLRSPELAFEM